jgi:aminopeptidase N
VLLPWLEKPSNHEELRNAALSALGRSKDAAALDALISWTKPGKAAACRPTATHALGELTKEAILTEGQRDAAVKALAALLSDESKRVRGSAISSLQAIGPPAKLALPMLDEIAAHDTADGNAEAAKKAAIAIRTPPPLPADVKQLREEVERLKKQQEELRNRLDKYEKKENKSP